MKHALRRSLFALAAVCALWALGLCVLGGCGGGGGAGDDEPAPIGEPPDAPYTISGAVKTAAGAAIAGATVTISTSPTQQTTTGSDGGYGFWVAAGHYTVTAEKSGYQPGQVSVTLLAGERTTAPDIVLSP
jgi:hypothetical protein